MKFASSTPVQNGCHDNKQDEVPRKLSGETPDMKRPEDGCQVAGYRPFCILTGWHRADTVRDGKNRLKLQCEAALFGRCLFCIKRLPLPSFSRRRSAMKQSHVSAVY
ncbi:MAG TPA: hypothetical protein VF296_06770 [Gallionella sp.]